MGIKGIIFMLAALCGLLINYFPKKTAAIFLRVREADYKCILKIKIASSSCGPVLFSGLEKIEDTKTARLSARTIFLK